MWLVAAVLVVAKLLLESIRGEPGLGGLVGAPFVPEAHVYGAISGALAFAFLYRPRRGSP